MPILTSQRRGGPPAASAALQGAGSGTTSSTGSAVPAPGSTTTAHGRERAPTVVPHHQGSLETSVTLTIWAGHVHLLADTHPPEPGSAHLVLPNHKDSVSSTAQHNSSSGRTVVQGARHRTCCSERMGLCPPS